MRLFFLGLALALTGCSGFKPTAELASSLSSQCTFANPTGVSACNISTNYVCDAQLVGGTPSVSYECATTADFGQVCMNIDISAASSSVGSVHCVNTEVRGASGFSYQGIGGSLEEALERAQQQCQAGI